MYHPFAAKVYQAFAAKVHRANRKWIGLEVFF